MKHCVLCAAECFSNEKLVHCFDCPYNDTSPLQHYESKTLAQRIIDLEEQIKFVQDRIDVLNNKVNAKLEPPPDRKELESILFDVLVKHLNDTWTSAYIWESIHNILNLIYKGK